MLGLKKKCVTTAVFSPQELIGQVLRIQSGQMERQTNSLGLE